jgi:hypothetical protein
MLTIERDALTKVETVTVATIETNFPALRPLVILLLIFTRSSAERQRADWIVG